MAPRHGKRLTVSKIIRIIWYCLLGILLLCAGSYALLLKTAPDMARNLLPYSGYIIKTDSMVPTIPVGSLVISKRLDPDESLDEGTIITFHANRFGDEIILTHYFRELQEIDGKLCYRTQAEEAPDYDSYETHREDIIGTYVLHIPYVGKAMEFLTSLYGLVMILALILIWLANRLMRSRMEHGGKGRIDVTGTHMSCSDGICTISGSLENHMGHPLQAVHLQITLYDEAKVLTCRYDPLDGVVLPDGEKRDFCFSKEGTGGVRFYRILSTDLTLVYTDVAEMPPRHMKKSPKKAGKRKGKQAIIDFSMENAASGEKQETGGEKALSPRETVNK